MDDNARGFEVHRERLRNLAHRVLGSADVAEGVAEGVTDEVADEVVLETQVRRAWVDDSTVVDEARLLTAVAVGVCLARLQSSETAAAFRRASALTIALRVVLDELSGPELAAYHDALAMPIDHDLLFEGQRCGRP